MFRRIVLGVDGSPESDKAIQVIAELAKRLGAAVIVVHALPDPASTVPMVAAVEAVPPPVMDPELLNRLEEAGRTVVEKAAAAMKAAGVSAETRLGHGDPGRVLVQAVRDAGGDLLVVGSRGHGRLEEMLLGSVSDAVARSAPCPVLIVR